VKDSKNKFHQKQIEFYLTEKCTAKTDQY